MRILYFIPTLIITLPIYSSEVEIHSMKEDTLLHRHHGEVKHPRAHDVVSQDKTNEISQGKNNKENNFKEVNIEIEKYKNILQNLKKEDPLFEHYASYKIAFETLKLEIEQNSHLDVKKKIASIHRQHNLFSDLNGY